VHVTVFVEIEQEQEQQQRVLHEDVSAFPWQLAKCLPERKNFPSRSRGEKQGSAINARCTFSPVKSLTALEIIKRRG
jgi:hypothetical protein